MLSEFMHRLTCASILAPTALPRFLFRRLSYAALCHFEVKPYTVTKPGRPWSRGEGTLTLWFAEDAREAVIKKSPLNSLDVVLAGVVVIPLDEQLS